RVVFSGRRELHRARFPLPVAGHTARIRTAASAKTFFRERMALRRRVAQALYSGPICRKCARAWCRFGLHCQGKGMENDYGIRESRQDRHEGFAHLSGMHDLWLAEMARLNS